MQKIRSRCGILEVDAADAVFSQTRMQFDYTDGQPFISCIDTPFGNGGRDHRSRTPLPSMLKIS